MGGVKAFRLEVKSLDEDGSFVGFASVYGNVDLVNEVVESGAFKRSLDRLGATRPLLWQHHRDEPIGTVEVVKDSAQGLEVKGRLVLDVARARECYALLKAGALKGLSIGYNTIKDEMVGAVRHLKELALREVSVVTIPANPLAQVVGVKSANREAIRSTIATLSALLEDAEEPGTAGGEGSEDPTAAGKATASQDPAAGSQDPPQDGASQELLEDATALLLDMTLGHVRA